MKITWLSDWKPCHSSEKAKKGYNFLQLVNQIYTETGIKTFVVIILYPLKNSEQLTVNNYFKHFKYL